MPSVTEKAAGRQYDILDKATANRAIELMQRSSIYRQDFDSFITSYNQLDAYARNNSNSYIAPRWADEIKRYNQVIPILQSKVRTADPSNYITSISISGQDPKGVACCNSCTGGGYTPGNYGGGGDTILPGRGSNIFVGGNTQLPSLGDAFRNLFNPQQEPFLDNEGLVHGSDIFSNVLTALIVGVILYVIHYVITKKGGSISA